MRSTSTVTAARAALLALGVLALLPAASVAQQTRPSDVRGKVVDAATGDPVAGAMVTVTGARRRAYTDRTGTFTVAGVAAGGHLLRVAQLGYAAVELAVAVPSADSLTVRMTAEPLTLQGITAQVDRMEYRRIHSTMASRSYDQGQIATFGHPNPVDFLRTVGNLRIARCNDRDASGGVAGECVTSRGVPERVQVVVDEHVERGGIAILNTMPLQDIYRIEVYEGGTIVLAYTKQFMQAMVRTQRALLPLNAFRRMTEAASPRSTPGLSPDP
jgi:hypothetical protein